MLKKKISVEIVIQTPHASVLFCSKSSLKLLMSLVYLEEMIPCIITTMSHPATQYLSGASKPPKANRNRSFQINVLKGSFTTWQNERKEVGPTLFNGKRYLTANSFSSSSTGNSAKYTNSYTTFGIIFLLGKNYIAKNLYNYNFFYGKE